MSKERVFDPEQIEDYRLFLVELLETLENQVIPVLSTGTLSRMPALGIAPGAAENAVGRYLEFHGSVWRNLQYLRGTLHGMETALAEAASGGEEAEADAAALFTSTEAGLDQGVPPGGAAEERLAPYESAPDDAGGDVVGLGGTETGADGTTAVGV